MERDYQGIPGKSLVIPSKIGKIVESRKGVAFFPHLAPANAHLVTKTVGRVDARVRDSGERGGTLDDRAILGGMQWGEARLACEIQWGEV